MLKFSQKFHDGPSYFSPYNKKTSDILSFPGRIATPVWYIFGFLFFFNFVVEIVLQLTTCSYNVLYIFILILNCV